MNTILTQNQSVLQARTAYFDHVILPLWLDIDPKSIGIDKITAYLPCMAFFAGDRIEIRSQLQTWAYQLAPTFPTYCSDELIKDYKFELSKVAGPYASTDPLKPITLNSDRILEDLEDYLISLDCKLSPPETRKALEHIATSCKDEVEFTNIVGGKMRGLVYGFDDGEWKNAIADFKRVIKRRVDIETYRPEKKVNDDLNPEDLKIKIKAFIQEKDQAKREVMLYELRKLGVGEKGVNRIAAQLSQNGTIPRATRLSASEFRSRISGGKKWLIPGLIPQVGVTLITGPSGGAKTTFAFDLAGSVICGTSFMGEAIKENGPVIFACSDEPTDESQERALLQGFFHSDDFEFLEQWNLSRMEMLEEAIEDRRPKAVIVDSFDSIHREAGFDENATMAGETIKQFNSLSQKYSCAFIVIHHENKDPKLSGVNKSRGHTSIVASANAHLRIIGKDDNPEVKYVKIEKMRGGATKTILCNVDYYSVRFEPEVNLEYEQDKDGRTALVSFLRSNLNRWFEVQELNHYLGWSGKGIYRYLKQLTDRGEISRKPNSMGRKGMVYGVMCTDGDNPIIDLTPPSLVKSVSQEKIISETIDIQGLEVSHNLVTSQSHLVTSQSHTITSEMPEMPSLTDSHTIDQKEGDIEGGGLTSQAVSTSDSVETTSIIEVETQIKFESENQQIIKFENVTPGQQNLEPSKNETGFAFELGDRVISIETPNLSLEIVSIDPDGEWCRCKNSFGIERYALSELIPDGF